MNMNCLLNMVKKLSRSHQSNNKGYVLPIVLVMLAVLTATALYLVNRNISEMAANQKSLNYEICLLTAKNGMEEIKALVSQQTAVIKGNADDPNGGYYDYELFKINDHCYQGQLKSVYRQYEKEFIIQIELTEETEKLFWEMK